LLVYGEAFGRTLTVRADVVEQVIAFIKRVLLKLS